MSEMKQTLCVTSIAFAILWVAACGSATPSATSVSVESDGVPALDDTSEAPPPAPSGPLVDETRPEDDVGTGSAAGATVKLPIQNGSAADSAAEQTPPAESVDPTAALVDETGAPLPQSDVRPSSDSPAFLAGGRRLFDAIVADDSERALPFFFPRIAYELVKDIPRPGRDWEWRLVGAFRRNVHEYHRVLGAQRAGAKFVRIVVPDERIQWMKPGQEGNRLGYYRVLRARLVYMDAGGREHELEITSMISWRGEWYVVHLHGFK